MSSFLSSFLKSNSTKPVPVRGESADGDGDGDGDEAVSISTSTSTDVNYSDSNVFENQSDISKPTAENGLERSRPLLWIRRRMSTSTSSDHHTSSVASASASQSTAAANTGTQRWHDLKRTEGDLADITTTTATLLFVGDCIALLKKTCEIIRSKSDDSFACASLELIISFISNANTSSPENLTSIKLNLVSNGAIGYIDQIIQSKINNEDTVRSCLQLLSLIIENSNDESQSTSISMTSNRKKFSNSGYCYRVIKACQLHISNPRLILWGLKVCRHLTLEDFLISKLILAGLCELLGNVAKTHLQLQTNVSNRNNNNSIESSSDALTMHENILEWTAKVIYNICYNDATCSTKLSDLGVCDISVIVLISMLGEIETETEDDTIASASVLSIKKAQSSLMLIGSLARRNDGNKDKFRVLGTCELIMKIAEKFNIQVGTFAESFCWALSNLGYPNQDNQRTFCEHGACEVIIRALTIHLTVEQTTIECLRSIRNLAHNSDFALNKFKENDVCSIILRCLHYYSTSPSVMQWAWYAISSLTQSPDLAVTLGDIGICRIIGDMLLRYKSNADIIQWVAISISELSMEPSLHKAFEAERTCKLMVEALATLLEVEEVVEECCFAIANIIRYDVEMPTVMLTVNSDVSSNVMPTVSSDISIDGSSTISSTVSSDGSSNVMPTVSSTVSISQYSKDFAEYSKFAIKKDLFTNTCIIDLLITKIFPSSIERSNDMVIRQAMYLLSNLVKRFDYAAFKKLFMVDNNELCEANSQEYSELLALVDKMTRHIYDAAGHVMKVFGKVLAKFSSSSEVVEFALHVLSEVFHREAGDAVKVSGGGMLTVVTCSMLTQVHNARVCEYGVNIYNAVMSKKGNMAKFAQVSISMASSPSSETLNAAEGINPQTSAGSGSGAAVVWDCAYAIAQVGLLHYTTQPDLIISILSLINELSASSLAMQIRLGQAGVCKMILQIIECHKFSSPNIIITACTTVSNLTTFDYVNNTAAAGGHEGGGVITTDVHENNQLFYDAGICEIMVGLLDLFSSNQEVLFFVLIAIDSVAGFDECRCKFARLHASLMILQAINDYLCIEGLITVALSTLGSLLQPGGASPSQPLAQAGLLDQQLCVPLPVHADVMAKAYMRVNPLLTLSTCERKYSSNAIICQCFCRVVAFMCTHNKALQDLMCNDDSTFNFCDRVMDILTVYTSQDHDTLKFACLAVAELASGDNAATIGRFQDLQVTQVVSTVLLKYYSIDAIAEACCRVIVSLSGLNGDFGQCGACELVIKALKVHSTQEAVLEWVCRAIGVLAEHPGNVGVLCDNHAPENILLTLQQHLQQDNGLYGLSKKLLSVGTSISGSQSASSGYNHAANELGASYQTTIRHNISSTEKYFSSSLKKPSRSSSMSSLGNIFQWGDSSAIHAMGGAMATLQMSAGYHPFSGTGTVLWGLLAIYYLLLGSDCNHTYQDILYINGICEVLCKLLSKYMESEHLAMTCFKAIVMSVSNNAVVRDRYGSLGLCSQVVEVMQIYPASVEIAHWGSRAIAKLAIDNDSNIAKFANAGVCEVISVAMLAHQSREDNARYGCEVIYNISRNQSNNLGARLGHSGACEAVVGILSKHIQRAAIALIAVKALGSLALTLGNSSWFGPAGACETLVDVIKIHHSIDGLVSACWLAVSNLCSVGYNRERFNALGTPQVLVKNLSEHRESALVGEYGIQVIGRLCEFRHTECQQFGPHRYRYKEYPTTFIENAPMYLAVEGLASSSVSNGSSPGKSSSSSSSTLTADLQPFPIPVLEASTETRLAFILKTLNIVLPGNRLSFYEAGVIQRMLNMLQIHMESDVVTYNIIKAIGIVAHGRESLLERLALGQLGACDLVTKAIIFHAENIGICVVGAQAIKALCTANDVSHFLGKLKGAKRELLESALPAISMIQKINQAKMEQSGVCQVIANLLRVHLKISPFNTDTHMNSSNSVMASINYQANFITDSLIEAVAGAVGNLCDACPYNRKMFGLSNTMKISNLLVYILNAYSKLSFEMTFNIVNALTHLCTDSPENISAVAFSTIADGINGTIQKYFSYFSDSAGTSPSNVPTVLSSTATGLGASTSSTVSTTRPCNEYDVLVESVCILISHLCTDKVAQYRLGVAVKATVSLLPKYERSSYHSSLLCMALASMGYKSSENLTKLAQTNVCKFLASLFEKHYSTPNSTGTSNPLASRDSPSHPSVLERVSNGINIARRLSTAPLFIESSEHAFPHDTTHTDPSHTSPDSLMSSSSSSSPVAAWNSAVCRPCLVVDGCWLIIIIASSSEASRLKLSSSALMDILTNMLASAEAAGSMGTVSSEVYMAAAGFQMDCARMAMDAITTNAT